ncbi:ABC transporter permease [Polluticoccus soli]|uniref:ABC transporter permease n=1 Tax=Polluticoccus soli TaxID=3034150 RepID=UPI0023E34365|nr:ABC transporter permease [Flavipsychrobacter sp. JY13-12]
MSSRDTNDTILQKLLKKPSAIIAISIILLTAMIALFAYLLAPDNTPNANRMIIELGAREPGFSKQLLLVPKTITQQRTNKGTEWLSGTPSDYNAIPLNGYHFNGDKLYIKHYIDEGLQDTMTFALQQLLPTGEKTKSIKEQRQYLEKHQIVKRTFYLGTDRYGRDILSRVIVGSRVSLAVGFVAVLLSITIGIILGSVAGYFGGIIDNTVMWVINILWAIPTLLLVFAITLTIGKGFWEIFIAIGLTMWVSAARLIRGQVLVIREMEYITAAKALGLGDARIIFRHILPNIAGPIMVIAASNFATAILIEAGLSFLGIGVQPPMPSWGLMIKEHYNFLLTNRPLLAIIPGIAIMLLVYAFNILGNALRDVLDVRA